jgi:hypothetical protein
LTLPVVFVTLRRFTAAPLTLTTADAVPFTVPVPAVPPSAKVIVPLCGPAVLAVQFPLTDELVEVLPVAGNPLSDEEEAVTFHVPGAALPPDKVIVVIPAPVEVPTNWRKLAVVGTVQFHAVPLLPVVTVISIGVAHQPMTLPAVAPTPSVAPAVTFMVLAAPPSCHSKA